MTKPTNFIQSSDYASLKNDSKGTVSLYIGASPALALNVTYTYEAFLDIGTVNSPIRCQIRNDIAPNTIYLSPQIQVLLQMTVTGSGGGVFPYYTTAYIERISPTKIRLACNVYGQTATGTTTITGGFQTITADVVTFLSPFN